MFETVFDSAAVSPELEGLFEVLNVGKDERINSLSAAAELALDKYHSFWLESGASSKSRRIDLILEISSGFDLASDHNREWLSQLLTAERFDPVDRISFVAGVIEASAKFTHLHDFVNDLKLSRRALLFVTVGLYNASPILLASHLDPATYNRIGAAVVRSLFDISERDSTNENLAELIVAASSSFLPDLRLELERALISFLFFQGQIVGDAGLSEQIRFAISRLSKGDLGDPVKSIIRSVVTSIALRMRPNLENQGQNGLFHIPGGQTLSRDQRLQLDELRGKFGISLRTLIFETTGLEGVV